MKICKRLYGAVLLSIAIVLHFGAMAQEPFAPGPQDISAEKAREIAWADMRINSGLTSIEIADFSCHLQVLEPLSEGIRYWTIVFVSGVTGSEYLVQVNFRTGEVFNTYHPGYAEEYRYLRQMAELQAIADKARIEMAKEMGPYEFWCYQDKAAFYEQYRAGHRRHLPGSDDMSEAEAIQLVRNETATALLADDAYIDSFRLDTGFSREWYWGETPTPTWIIAYRSREPASDGSYPARHQAIVNAQTGEVVLMICADGQSQAVTGDTYLDTMYYNPDGGKYFHHDAQCPAVSAAYRPLRAYSRGDIIHSDALLSLTPCQRCVCNNDRDWGTDWTRG